MSMQIFLGIIASIVVIYIWIWIINNAFKKKKFKRRFSINIFVLSLFLVAFLYFYKDLLAFFQLEHLYFLTESSWKTILSFVIYCFSFIIILSGSFWNISKKPFLKFTFTALLLFVWIGIWWAVMGINILLMYYIISSYAEEILKFSIGQNVFLEKQDIDKHIDMSTWEQKQQLSPVDLLFFAIVAWLWFSIIENVFYLVISQLSNSWWVIMSLWRSIFTTLLHVTTTWLIAYFIVKKQNKKKFLNYFIGILSGFTLHSLYNISLEYQLQIFSIIILIACYFILSYLLFNSDLIYQKK